ncbi:hypothetical protein B0H15DRAFT_945683 [Mycena belliarum]|uniref:Uncharacterized protein n=1 Tax=Mycena belliarum TaxID=1033014 RepID=A0AAD6UCG1_9AGAR|nr:hypothetical protein B0H15DRAFT_945683 [Mycena belliae]
MPAVSSANHILVSAYLGTRDATEESSIPVGAMVGGLVGGAMLAIHAQQKTKTNTRYNASTLAQPWAEVRPTLLRPPQARVKFTEKGRTTLSGPKPLRSIEGDSPLEEHKPARVPRLPSTVSSTSLYSAESGEEHQIRAPTSLILAALGSFEAVLARGSWGDRRAHYRGSQATSGSAYSQDVGVAY